MKGKALIALIVIIGMITIGLELLPFIIKEQQINERIENGAYKTILTFEGENKTFTGRIMNISNATPPYLSYCGKNCQVIHFEDSTEIIVIWNDYYYQLERGKIYQLKLTRSNHSVVNITIV